MLRQAVLRPGAPPCLEEPRSPGRMQQTRQGGAVRACCPSAPSSHPNSAAGQGWPHFTTSSVTPGGLNKIKPSCCKLGSVGPEG